MLSKRYNPEFLVTRNVTVCKWWPSGDYEYSCRETWPKNRLQTVKKWGTWDGYRLLERTASSNVLMWPTVSTGRFKEGSTTPTKSIVFPKINSWISCKHKQEKSNEQNSDQHKTPELCTPSLESPRVWKQNPSLLSFPCKPLGMQDIEICYRHCLHKLKPTSTK